MGDTGNPRWVVALAAAVGAVVFVASMLDGPPRALPDVALGWAPILYVERAALMALVIIALGGLSFGLIHGDRVRSVGGGALPSIDLEQARPPQARLDERTEREFARLGRWIAEVEARVERLEKARASAETEE